MSPILVILNLVALLFMAIILFVVDKSFKLLFLLGMLVPIVVWFIVAIALNPQGTWSLVDIIMMFLRGSLILGVLSGALACYIVTKIKQN